MNDTLDTLPVQYHALKHLLVDDKGLTRGKLLLLGGIRGYGNDHLACLLLVEILMSYRTPHGAAVTKDRRISVVGGADCEEFVINELYRNLIAMGVSDLGDFSRDRRDAVTKWLDGTNVNLCIHSVNSKSTGLKDIPEMIQRNTPTSGIDGSELDALFVLSGSQDTKHTDRDALGSAMKQLREFCIAQNIPGVISRPFADHAEEMFQRQYPADPEGFLRSFGTVHECTVLSQVDRAWWVHLEPSERYTVVLHKSPYPRISSVFPQYAIPLNVRTSRHASHEEPEEPTLGDFQQRTDDWTQFCFGDAIARDKEERCHRVAEEVLELLQAAGYTRSQVDAMADYVFSRETGDVAQEAGGTLVTFIAFLTAHDLQLEQVATTELEKITALTEAIREKHRNKPEHLRNLTGTKSPKGE